MQKLYQGAEAIITKEDTVIKKERIKKGYRITSLDDSIREKRTRAEAKLIRDARRSGVLTPQIIEEDKFVIKMEFIEGLRVKDLLNKKNFKTLAEKIGESIGKLHNYNIIHGDLTTSNMIVKASKENKSTFDIYFIDFGLGFSSTKIEDKATDLHLLKEALESTHFDTADKAWKAVLDAYLSEYPAGEKVIKALSKIEKRGRYAKR